jgi:hypothetical protein
MAAAVAPKDKYVRQDNVAQPGVGAALEATSAASAAWLSSALARPQGAVARATRRRLVGR